MFAYLNIVDFELAPNRVSNEQLVKEYPEYTEEFIVKNFGINNRYTVDYGTVCSDFAAESTLKLIAKHKLNKKEFDFLIYCTEAPDYIAPASSVVLHNKLGLANNTGTFDLQFGCSGYTYGLLLAKSLIESGIANKILFVTADIPSQVIANKDEQLRFLFSDAVSMSVISSENIGFKIGDFISGTDGDGEQALRVEQSGFYQPKNINWYLNEDTKQLMVGRMAMDGLAVFRFSMNTVPKAIDETLKKNNLEMKDIHLFIFHQASRIILRSLQKKLRIEDARIFNNIDKIGNTVSASIPIAISEAIEQQKIKERMNILIIGFGIGFSWSATVLKT